MARSREHVFSGLWSRDRGCYWWVSEVIAGRVGASRLFAAYVVSIHDAFRCIDGSVAYDLALVFLLLRFSLRVRFFLHLALILGCCGICQSLVTMVSWRTPMGSSKYSHLLRMRWDEGEKEGRSPGSKLYGQVDCVCGAVRPAAWRWSALGELTTSSPLSTAY